MAVGAGGPVVGADQSGKHSTAGSHGSIPVADGVLGYVVDFPDGFLAPFACFGEYGRIVIDKIIFRRVDYFLHVSQGFGIAGCVALVHYYLGVEHVCHGGGNASGLFVGSAERQCVESDSCFDITYHMRIEFVGRNLGRCVGHGEIAFVVRHIAVELPKPVRVEGTQHTHLRGPGSDVGVGCIVDASLDVLENVVAALDSAERFHPQACDYLERSGRIVGHQVPVLVVGGIGAAHPEVVGHNVGHEGEGRVFVAGPVGPLQRVVGGHYGLFEVFFGGEVFVGWSLGGRLYFKERVGACTHCQRGQAGSQESIYLVHGIVVLKN